MSDELEIEPLSDEDLEEVAGGECTEDSCSSKGCSNGGNGSGGTMGMKIDANMMGM
ncbi:MAG: hypothetical protein AAGM22_32690 [Acidobacteriota bacterium]